MDVSSEAIHALLPIYLTSVLGLSAATLGIMVRDLGTDGRVDMSAMAGDFVGDDPQGAWAEASKQATEAWGGDGVLAKTVTMPWGAQMPAPMALSILRNDVFGHTWDLARATGQSTDLDAEVSDVR